MVGKTSTISNSAFSISIMAFKVESLAVGFELKSIWFVSKYYAIFQ